MKNKIRVALAATVVGALTIGTAAPASAQEEPATLGFAVDKTQAQPGALVLGKADAADVAEHCVTDLETFQARFAEQFEIFNSFEEGGFALRFFPDFDGDFQDLIQNHDQLAYQVSGLAALGIGANFGGAAEDALPQTFVITFADIATQVPVGERDTFDPSTGEGSVVVPDIEPGLWAVAAACVGPIIEDLDALEAGIRANGDFLEEIGAPVVDVFSEEFEEFAQDFLDTETTGLAVIAEFIEETGIVEPIVTPDAFGAVLFCILDAEGNCPADEEPPPPPGEPIEPAEPTPAEPVVAAPTFTG